MSRRLGIWLAVLAALAGGGSARAFVRETIPNTPTCLYWNVRTMTWSFYQSPDHPGTAGGNDWATTQAAIQTASQAWQNASGTDIQFTYKGSTSNYKTAYNSNGCGNMNLVIFRDHVCTEPGIVPAGDKCLTDTPEDCGENYDCWDDQSGGVDGVIARTTDVYDTMTGEIVGAAMEFNAATDMSTGLPFNHYTVVQPGDGLSACASADDPTEMNCIARDVQNVATHEWGHFLGFGHSLSTSATMYAYSDVGDVAKRNLSADDVQGVATVYPAGAQTLWCVMPVAQDDYACQQPAKKSGCAAAGGADLLALTFAAMLLWRRRTASH
jgi:hypothetical protein